MPPGWQAGRRSAPTQTPSEACAGDSPQPPGRTRRVPRSLRTSGTRCPTSRPILAASLQAILHLLEVQLRTPATGLYARRRASTARTAYSTGRAGTIATPPAPGVDPSAAPSFRTRARQARPPKRPLRCGRGASSPAAPFRSRPASTAQRQRDATPAMRPGRGKPRPASSWCLLRSAPDMVCEASGCCRGGAATHLAHVVVSSGQTVAAVAARTPQAHAWLHH